MRDPDSVQFCEVKSAAEDFVCGEVNAKNGFGAYSGFTAFVYYTFIDRVCIADVSTDCGQIFNESICSNTAGGREAALRKSFILYSEGSKTGQLNGFFICKDFYVIRPISARKNSMLFESAMDKKFLIIYRLLRKVINLIYRKLLSF
jgi:hypothetical protein